MPTFSQTSFRYIQKDMFVCLAWNFHCFWNQTTINSHARLEHWDVALNWVRWRQARLMQRSTLWSLCDDWRHSCNPIDSSFETASIPDTQIISFMQNHDKDFGFIEMGRLWHMYSEEIVTMRFKSVELNKSILEYDAWDWKHAVLCRFEVAYGLYWGGSTTLCPIPPWPPIHKTQPRLYFLAPMTQSAEPNNPITHAPHIPPPKLPNNNIYFPIPCYHIGGCESFMFSLRW